jgi:hypothetical protein
LRRSRQRRESVCNLEDTLSGLIDGLERADFYARATTFEGAIVQLALAWNAVDEMHAEAIRELEAEPNRDHHACYECHQLKALLSSVLVLIETHVGKTAEQLGMSLYICRPRRSDLPNPAPAG